MIVLCMYVILNAFKRFSRPLQLANPLTNWLSHISRPFFRENPLYIEQSQHLFFGIFYKKNGGGPENGPDSHVWRAPVYADILAHNWLGEELVWPQIWNRTKNLILPNVSNEFLHIYLWSSFCPIRSRKEALPDKCACWRPLNDILPNWTVQGVLFRVRELSRNVNFAATVSPKLSGILWTY